MSFALYMDVHVRAAITRGLRQRRVDVLTAQEDHAGRLSDSELLDRAAVLGRVVFTNAVDFLVEATNRQRANTPFAGVVYAHQRHVTVGRCVTELEILATVLDLADIANQIVYLPL